MMVYLVLSGGFLTYLRRPMGKMTVREQKLEGEVRFVNSRLITYSEEIAFYNGNIKEKSIFNSVFSQLVSFICLCATENFAVSLCYLFHYCKDK